MTEFIISCSGWMDEGDYPTRDPVRDANNTVVLRYTYLQRAKGSDETLVIYRGGCMLCNGFTLYTVNKISFKDEGPKVVFTLVQNI